MIADHPVGIEQLYGKTSFGSPGSVLSTAISSDWKNDGWEFTALFLIIFTFPYVCMEANTHFSEQTCLHSWRIQSHSLWNEMAKSPVASVARCRWVFSVREGEGWAEPNTKLMFTKTYRNFSCISLGCIWLSILPEDPWKHHLGEVGYCHCSTVVIFI